MLVELVGAVVGSILGVLALLGVVWRYVLLPNLREQLLDPVEETHRQVTVNRHASPEPTVLDRLDNIQASVQGLGESVDGLGDRVELLNTRADRNYRLANAAGQRADEAHKRMLAHDAWADREVSRLWSAILGSTRGRPRQKGDDDESGNQGGA